MDQNCKLQLHSISAKIQDFEGFFKHCFSYLRLPLVKVSARSNSAWGSKSQKIPKMDHFIDAESIKNKFENFENFTTTHAILMKRTTYMLNHFIDPESIQNKFENF